MDEAEEHTADRLHHREDNQGRARRQQAAINQLFPVRLVGDAPYQEHAQHQPDSSRRQNNEKLVGVYAQDLLQEARTYRAQHHEDRDGDGPVDDRAAYRSIFAYEVPTLSKLAPGGINPTLEHS